MPQTSSLHAMHPEEPLVQSWVTTSIAELLTVPLPRWRPLEGRPVIVAIDGRGASGKSTLARSIQASASRSFTVHTDDIAWHEPFFAWDHLLLEGILEPLHRGRAVDYRPPAWSSNNRAGSIVIPSGLDLVLVEGTGAGHRAFTELSDALIWVQSDPVVATRRGIERDVAAGVNGDRDQAEAFWHDWTRAEVEFLREQQPWVRADLVVDGTPPSPLPLGELRVARAS